MEIIDIFLLEWKEKGETGSEEKTGFLQEIQFSLFNEDLSRTYSGQTVLQSSEANIHTISPASVSQWLNFVNEVIA